MTGITNERLFEAFAEISDRHIMEFSDIKPRKSHKAVRLPLICAACLALVIAAAPVINKFIGIDQIINTEYPYNNFTTPLVSINGEVYTYAGDDKDVLPEGFAEVGAVENDKNSDFYSNACKPGEKVYANPDDPENIYVYTRLFHGENYWYVRFNQSN